MNALDLIFSKTLGIKNTYKLLKELMPLFAEKSGTNPEMKEKLTFTRFQRGRVGLPWLD